MEIQAPSAQRQQMAEIEKSTEAANQVTQVQTRTVNVHGDELQVVTTTQYEQQTFSSKTDWRIRAISATNLSLRLQHVYVTNEQVRDELPTFVMAKNILKSFVISADLRTPICAYLYGVIADDNSRVIEIKAIVVAPQRSSQRSIELYDQLPKHPIIDDLKLVGVAITQSQEGQTLSPNETIFFSKLMANHNELTATSILLTVAFTPGSLSLSSYALTPKGFEWGRSADPNSPNGKLRAALYLASKFEQCAIGYNPSTMTERAQLLLSDRILGSCFAPVDATWNCMSTYPLKPSQD